MLIFYNLIVLQEEPYSPSRPVSPSNPPLPTLANIVIPSNLQDILASIKNVPTAASVKEEIFPSGSNSTHNEYPAPSQPPIISSITTSNDEEYNPISTSGTMYSAFYEPGKSLALDDSQSSNPSTHSKLAQLSDAELMSMVPDDALIFPPESVKNRNIETTVNTTNKGTLDEIEPPPPGLEDEYMPV